MKETVDCVYKNNFLLLTEDVFWEKQVFKTFLHCCDKVKFEAPGSNKSLLQKLRGWGEGSVKRARASLTEEETFDLRMPLNIPLQWGGNPPAHLMLFSSVEFYVTCERDLAQACD